MDIQERHVSTRCGTVSHQSINHTNTSRLTHKHTHTNKMLFYAGDLLSAITHIVKFTKGLWSGTLRRSLDFTAGAAPWELCISLARLTR